MNDSYFAQYLFLGLFLLVAIAFPILPLVLAKIVAPKKNNPIKNSTYECGIEASGDAWIQFKAQYYVYALIFIVFDIETIFIYPWAVAYNQLGLFALLAMALFLFLLTFGLIYAWKKNILEWK
ncbi:MAG: NADH-quinone oxidoreductase subunit A [Candidatus Omnitrophica bacterium CG11_big_fil_rev_8_21_14_0_20_45_26]|uniref:NADH-quinone oxidoreductase subunit A n=1 Tax=Candidatus Abzuiibacterium crystallinum TaxID=1974748 RepID=A0A2H0LMA6_9BACT|nr:MAG: NADH-quinone oxidoreductase subunit A [Candidatus Omnitrophica bacterium CG11_big_fil_rev_8_21_14_0_20_45_26]PIW63671.1 MAG: NADH-quinone oxidoreductase subunit A [Candidatus Omnitrophica bacterium CG12_big_fil_rev_8_21_14_0_65_45_16]